MKKNVLILLLSFFMIGMIFSSPLFAQTAEDQVAVLIRTINNLNLDDYVDHRLFVKLDVVQKSLEKGNYKPAVNNMHTFKTEVAVILKISDKTKINFLTKEQADILLSQADMVIGLISNTTAADIGAPGGSISVRNSSLPITGSSVEIPQGALTTDTVITITQDTTAPAMPSNFSNAGPAVDFGPSGLTFQNPVIISIPYNPRSDVTKIKLLSLSGDQWTEIPITNIDTFKKLVYAQVSHFSTYQAAEGAGDPGAPVFNWIDLWNINSAGNNVIAMGCSVTDPNGPDQSFMPNNISNLKVEAPDGSTYYQFIEGDWTYNWATNGNYYWRFIRLSTPSDWPLFPPGGTYKFSVTDVEGLITEQSKTLTIDPIPPVDYRTVQISRDGVNWISQVPNGGFEQVALTGQSLWIKWDSVDNLTEAPQKIYYYRVQIRNRTYTLLHNSKLLDGYGIDRVEIPIEVLNNILHERSFYRIRIEVFDTGYEATASNKSESNFIPLTTGDLRLSDPVIDWAVVVRNTWYSGTELEDQLLCMFAFIAPNVTLDQDLMTAIVTLPDGSFYTKNDFNWGSNNNLNYWLPVQDPPSVYPTGRVLFQATYDGKDYFFEDFFNFSRKIIPPELTFGSDSFPFPLLVQKPVILTWNPSLSCKSYEVKIEEYNLVNGIPTWTRPLYLPWYTPVIQNGNTSISYPVPNNAYFYSEKIYRWQIRAYEGTALGDSDGRTPTSYKYFKVQ